MGETMKTFLDKAIELGTQMGGKIVIALVVLIVGLLIIKAIKKFLVKRQNKTKIDKTASNVMMHIITTLLYVLLIIGIIEILGVPMTSVAAVLASCGLAIGLALQGALGNFAGGLMILIFRPFKVGDYVEASGAEGFVRDISIFYTQIMTMDNKRITVPNGDLMNSNVTNFTCEDLRRVDLDFKTTNDSDQNFTKAVLLKAAEETDGVMTEPAPVARMVGVDDDTYIFTVRGWCKSENYWPTYFNLIENCAKALADNGIDDPEERIAVRLVNEQDKEEEEI